MKWERGEYRGKEWGRERGRYGSAGNGNARKIAPKRNRFGIYGHPLGATTDRPVSYIF